ncbi:MAG: hypothetical protein CMI96_04560 [Pelagibacteraceae bacterium]|nr:hypothetical protein [Pelagibacteraceae bacterium]|tara:strand:+ start:9601 stop:10005 length:405 start_codon:yes stop_codon:yes gene_type:complete
MFENKSYSKIKIGSNRAFGNIFGTIFIIIFFYFLLVLDNFNIFFLFISLLFYLVAFFYPKYLFKFNYAWFKFGNFIGHYVASFVMLFIFFIVVMPTGLILKLFNKDILRKKINYKEKSYWLKRESEINSMKNQF